MRLMEEFSTFLLKLIIMTVSTHHQIFYNALSRRIVVQNEQLLGKRTEKNNTKLLNHHVLDV